MPRCVRCCYGVKTRFCGACGMRQAKTWHEELVRMIQHSQVGVPALSVTVRRHEFTVLASRVNKPLSSWLPDGYTPGVGVDQVDLEWKGCPVVRGPRRGAAVAFEFPEVWPEQTVTVSYDEDEDFWWRRVDTL